MKFWSGRRESNQKIRSLPSVDNTSTVPDNSGQNKPQPTQSQTVESSVHRQFQSTPEHVDSVVESNQTTDSAQPAHNHLEHDVDIESENKLSNRNKSADAMTDLAAIVLVWQNLTPDIRSKIVSLALSKSKESKR